MDHAPIPFNPVTTPGPQTGIQLNLMADIVPPNFPDGVVVVLQRPGELGVVCTVPLPAGCMLAVIDPATAEHLRPGLLAEQARQKRAVEKQRNGLGQRR